MFSYKDFLRGRLLLTSLVMAMVLIGCNRPAEDNPSTMENQDLDSTDTGVDTIVSGTVTNATGQPISGALVKVRGAETGLSYMVVSQEQGGFSTPELLPGNYTVQAIGGRSQSDLDQSFVISTGEKVDVKLVLNANREILPPLKKRTNLEYKELMPDGGAKEIIAGRCVLCHGLDRVVPARKSPQAWQITVDRMAFFLEERQDLAGPLSNQDKQSILDYLSTHFTRDAPRVREPRATDPNQFLPGELLQGEQARFIAMEFDPPNRDNSSGTEFGLDSRGNVWISEVDTAFFGWVDPSTFSYSRIETPLGGFPRGLAQIAADPEDKIWIMDSGSSPAAELLHYDPVSAAFNSIRITAPLRYRAPINTLRFLDGNVWGTGNASSRVVKIAPDTGQITSYPATRGSHPFGIAIGADKAVWYITNYNNEIIRLNPQTGEQTPYQPATPRSGLRRMGADAVGNLWAGAQDSNKLVKLDSRTGEFTEYTVPTPDSGPYSVDVDTTRNLVWFSERDANKLGRFDPDTETFVEFPLPAAGIEARRILVDPVNPNRVWWNCSEGCSIGYIETLE